MPSKTSKRASVRRQPSTRRTTVALPIDLLNAADKAVGKGLFASRADLLSQALRRELAAQERAAIDAAFEEMANDPEYQEEALRITEEFAVADWEALQLGDRELRRQERRR
jgi:Arc/MetJ-type ribon-helix-helix transcriptional regulator